MLATAGKKTRDESARTFTSQPGSQPSVWISSVIQLGFQESMLTEIDDGRVNACTPSNLSLCSFSRAAGCVLHKKRESPNPSPMTAMAMMMNQLIAKVMVHLCLPQLLQHKRKAWQCLISFTESGSKSSDSTADNRPSAWGKAKVSIGGHLNGGFGQFSRASFVLYTQLYAKQGCTTSLKSRQLTIRS